MGLLERAIASNVLPSPEGGGPSKSGASKIETLIADFSRKNSSFHCIVLHGEGVTDIPPMVDSHGAQCVGLADGKCLVLLPGVLDRELFAHRIANSSGSIVLFQTSVNSSSLAIEMLSPYL